MATIRISSKQIKAIKVEDKKTWPVDLEVWVELSTYHHMKEWAVPFYLLPDQINMFKKIIAAAVKKRNEKVRRW